ncbi:MAG: response regulator [Micrococcales bacterium]
MFSRQIILVENEALLRDLIAKSLDAAGFSVLTAANAADAKRAFAANDPDGMVVDIELGPGPDGMDLSAAIVAESPETAIVFLTNLPDPRIIGKDSAGIPKHAAYLRKSALVDSNDLVDALNAVLTGSDLKDFRHDLMTDRPFADLSRKQIEVLRQVANGLSNQQIAEARRTSIRAVEGIVSRTFDALGIDVQAEGNARVEAAKLFFVTTRPGE